MAGIEVREAVLADLPQIGAVALATGQDEEWGGLEPAGGRARVCLPGPHPAVGALLAAGWRIEEFDLFMTTVPGLLDPQRAVPSPALA